MRFWRSKTLLLKSTLTQVIKISAYVSNKGIEKEEEKIEEIKENLEDSEEDEAVTIKPFIRSPPVADPKIVKKEEEVINDRKTVLSIKTVTDKSKKRDYTYLRIRQADNLTSLKNMAKI